MPLRRQTIDLPFGGGLSGKADKSLLQPPKLLDAVNVEFGETGGLQKRRPFSAMSNKILGGGTLSDVRKLQVYGDELVAFTKDSVYSWAPGLERWVLRDNHMALSVTELPRFVNATEQRSIDSAENGGVQIFVWTEQGTDPKVAALDAETGAVIYGPVDWPGDGGSASFVRCLPIGDSILIVLGDALNGDIFCVVVDPSDISGTISNTSAVNSSSDAQGHFDVAVIDNKAWIAWVRTTTTAYGLGTITEAQAISRGTEARTADGVIGIAARGTVGSPKVCVMRAEGTTIDADLFDDVTFDTNVATVGTIDAGDDQLTCAWRSVAESGGEYRCYGFWSSTETDDGSTDFETVYNYVDDAGSKGTAANLVKKCGVVSHAFDHDGSIYVWIGFAASGSSGGLSNPLGFRAQLQNTYFLYRDDGELVGKCVSQRSGGFANPFGHLPTVQHLGGPSYRWTGIERRVIPIGDQDDDQAQSSYSARSPVEIRFDFDCNSARRAVHLGETLYVAGAPLSQYDGESVVELGWHTFPFYFDLLELGTGSPAIPINSTHSFKATVSWPNAKGELDRSSVATVGQSKTTATARWQLDVRPVSVTRKTGDRAEAAMEVWRTKTDPVPGAAFYMTTNNDPTDTSGDNRYIANDPTAAVLSAFTDNFTDAVLETKEPNGENGGVLESLTPPVGSVIFANDERVFLAGIANDPHKVYYSKLREAGHVASFNDALQFDVPLPGGAITAISEFYGNLVVFKESAVYTFPGEGFSNTGQGSNYGGAQVVSQDAGAVAQEGVVLTPDGLMFKSAKGWYIFDRGFTVRYIGDDVAAFDDEAVLSAVVLEDRHQVRVMTPQRCLVFDLTTKQWARWTIEDAVDAVLWQGKYIVAKDSSIHVEDVDFSNGCDYSMVIETAWIRLNGLQGYGRCRAMSLLGQWRSPHSLKIEVARDDSDDYFQSKTWAPTSTDIGPTGPRHSLQIQKLSAVKFRLTDMDVDGVSPPPGESLALSGISLELGIKMGHRRRGAANTQ